MPVAALALANGHPNNRRETALITLAFASLVVGAAGLYARERLLLGLLLPTGVITVFAWLVVAFLLSAFGSCSAGSVPLGGWIAFGAVYVGGAVWGFRRALRALWAVPASVLAGGLCLLAVALAVTGSTGMCFE